MICGYIFKGNDMASLVIGQYHQGQLVYKGHVTLGVSGKDFKKITSTKHVDSPFYPMPKGNEEAVWIKPVLVGVVKYMEKTESGSLRQPVFKGLRDDKKPIQCKDKKTSL